jgi:hypothetical protein
MFVSKGALSRHRKNCVGKKVKDALKTPGGEKWHELVVAIVLSQQRYAFILYNVYPVGSQTTIMQH